MTFDISDITRYAAKTKPERGRARRLPQATFIPRLEKPVKPVVKVTPTTQSSAVRSLTPLEERIVNLGADMQRAGRIVIYHLNETTQEFDGVQILPSPEDEE